MTLLSVREGWAKGLWDYIRRHSKITQTHESRMTTVYFGGLADHDIVICERGL